jgi:hypothetical protein
LWWGVALVVLLASSLAGSLVLPHHKILLNEDKKALFLTTKLETFCLTSTEGNPI